MCCTITWSSRKEWVQEMAFFGFFYIVVFFALTFLKQGFAPMAIPWADAFASATAYTGMWLMARKKVESWYWWIATNIASIPLYFVKHYVFTSVYYLILLVMALSGLVEWRRRVKTDKICRLERSSSSDRSRPASPRCAKRWRRIFDTEWVREYAREYLEEHGMKYGYETLTMIARGQLALEDKRTADKEAKQRETEPGSANGLLFIDTDLYVIKVWSEYVFGRCEAWILDEIVRRKYDGYLFANTDLPWADDPLREYPDPGDPGTAVPYLQGSPDQSDQCPGRKSAGWER